MKEDMEVKEDMGGEVNEDTEVKSENEGSEGW